MRYKPFLILSVVLLGVVLYGNFAIAIDAAHFVGHPIFVQLSRNIGGAATAMTSCTDSDGGRFADIFGTITGTGFDGRTYRWNDQCLSPTQLLERFCINNAPGGDEINCAGCSAGVCQSSGSGGGGGGGVPPSTCTVDSQCAIGSLCLNSVCQRVTALQCSLPGDANANGRLDCADKECARRATLELPTLDCSVACMSLAPIGNPDMRVSIADYMVVTRLVEQRGINCTNQTNATQSPPAACSDGADNDRDGFIDYPADSGCTSSADTNEHGNAVCDDGLDNDGDGQRDFPSDAGCANPSDGDETNPQPSYPSSSPPPPPQSRSAISERYCTSTSQCADGALCLSNGCRRVTALGCSKPGDANDNGQINCLDVTCATTPTGAGCRRECIDVSPVGSPDGQITAADVDIIRQLTVQLGHNCNVPASPPPAPTPTPTPSGTPPPASVPPAPSSGQPECSDGRDNDLDTRIDFPRDPGCSGNTDSNEKGSMACDDGVDNDGDSKIDYHPSTPDQNDFGCEGPQDTSEKNEFGHCDNGKDDDADGKIDYPADSGCLREWDHSEFSHLNGGTCWDSDGGIILEVAGTVTGFDAGGVLRSFSDFCESDNAVKEWRCIGNADWGAASNPCRSGCIAGRCRGACDDGIYNDYDGLQDFPRDPGCADARDLDEHNPQIACDDGADNDGDNLRDYPGDAGCTGPTDTDEYAIFPERCTDSDGGRNWAVAGTVTRTNQYGGQDVRNDVCSGNGIRLYEKYCDGVQFAETSKRCTCVNRRCVS